MDTSTLTAADALLDLSFNPGVISGTQAASATISQFAGAMPDPAQAAFEKGDVAGTLFTGLQFGNGKQLNGFFAPVVLGSSFQFLLTLSGPAVSAPDSKASYGSEFVLGLTSNDGSTPLLTSDGLLAAVGVGPGTAPLSLEMFSSAVSIRALASDASSIPEPATARVMWLGALCAAALYCLQGLSRVGKCEQARKQ